MRHNKRRDDVKCITQNRDALSLRALSLKQRLIQNDNLAGGEHNRFNFKSELVATLS